jgi:hypothetical protein
MAVSNNITACINFIALLCTIPVAATGLWLLSKQGEDCARLARWPVAVVGGLLLLVALMGFLGAYWNRKGLLPLRHGRAHHAAPGAPRLRLRRLAGVRRAARAGARVRGLPATGVLPAAVGGDQDLHRRVRHVLEARAGHRLHRAGAVLRVAPLANPGNSFSFTLAKTLLILFYWYLNSVLPCAIEFN